MTNTATAVRANNSIEARRSRIEIHLSSSNPDVLDESTVAEALYDLRALKSAALTSAFVSKFVQTSPARLRGRVLTLALQELQQYKLASHIVEVIRAALRLNSDAVDDVNVTVAMVAMRSIGREHEGVAMFRDVVRREQFKTNVVLQGTFLSLLSKSQCAPEELLVEAEALWKALDDSKVPLSQGTYAPLLVICGRY
jgi:hypothetical protein